MLLRKKRLFTLHKFLQSARRKRRVTFKVKRYKNKLGVKENIRVRDWTQRYSLFRSRKK